MLDSGFMRVVAVGIGIGAGLLVPWLRHHNDPAPTPRVYVDPPYIQAPPPDIATQIPDVPVGDHDLDGKLHFAIALPDNFSAYYRHSSAVSFSSDADTLVRIEEWEPDLVMTLRTAAEVANAANNLGEDVDTTQVKARLSDGRYPFTTFDSTPGWFATKMCGDRQIVIAVEGTSKKEMQQTIAAFHKARCTKDLQAY